jgi:hypothetical protein
VPSLPLAQSLWRTLATVGVLVFGVILALALWRLVPWQLAAAVDKSDFLGTAFAQDCPKANLSAKMHLNLLTVQD